MALILIIEDERNAAQSLKDLIIEASQDRHVEFVYANSYNAAVEALTQTAFDLVFDDLLLLPDGIIVRDGKLIKEDSRSSWPFSPDDWDKYVLQRGGLGVARFVRFGQKEIATRRNVPLVVTSYFDSLPGYGKTVRSIQSQPETLLLPKFYKNPEYPDYAKDIIIHRLALQFFQALLGGEITTARVMTEEIRSELFERRLRMIDVVKEREKNSVKLKRLIDAYSVLTYNFTLIIEFDPSKDSKLDWNCALDTDYYELSLPYESWQDLRDSILLNPKVPVRLSLRVSNIRSRREDLIRLTKLSEPHWFARGLWANEVKGALKRRVILAYLAFVAEPPVIFANSSGLVEQGWTIREQGLQMGAMKGIERLPLLQYENPLAGGKKSYFLSWPACSNPVNLSEFVDMSNGRGAVRALIREIRGRLDQDLNEYYKGDTPFSADHIIVSPDEGYFFNGDIELQPFNHHDQDSRQDKKFSANLALERVFHWPMGHSQAFECLDGAVITDTEIEERLKKSFHRVTRVSNLNAVLEQDGGNRDCLLCAPVNMSGLEWWNTEIQNRNQGIQQLLKRGVRVILAPNSEVSAAADSEVFARLRAANIHCIYTANFSAAIPEAKIIDAVLCSGPRVKYRSKQIEEAEKVQWWDEDVIAVEKELRAAYTKLREAGALGDQFSGSASVRWGKGRGICLITASQTDKIKLGKRNVTGLIRYSPSLNEALWVGERRPSSSTPWHSRIYHERPDVKAILHIHNKAVTYSDNLILAAMRTEKYEPYGTIQLGGQVLEQIRNGSGLAASGVILNSHGEVAVGVSISSCVDTLIEMDRLAKSIANNEGWKAKGGY